LLLNLQPLHNHHHHHHTTAIAAVPITNSFTMATFTAHGLCHHQTINTVVLCPALQISLPFTIKTTSSPSSTTTSNNPIHFTLNCHSHNKSLTIAPPHQQPTVVSPSPLSSPSHLTATNTYILPSQSHHLQAQEIHKSRNHQSPIPSQESINHSSPCLLCARRHRRSSSEPRHFDVAGAITT
jgi:hypothetical protein